jgi:hypothetical protein
MGSVIGGLCRPILLHLPPPSLSLDRANRRRSLRKAFDEVSQPLEFVVCEALNTNEKFSAVLTRMSSSSFFWIAALSLLCEF